jgi:hypothetical protein
MDNSITLYLGTRWKRVFSFTPRPLYFQGKSPRYPLNRRLGGIQSRSGRPEGDKNILPKKRIKSRPSSLSLYRLSYPGIFKISLFKMEVTTVVRMKRVLWPDNCKVTQTRVRSQGGLSCSQNAKRYRRGVC